MRPRRYPYSTKKLNIASVRKAVHIPKYPGHLQDVVDNIELRNKLKNAILQFKLDIITNADTENPAMVAAIARLINSESTTIL